MLDGQVAIVTGASRGIGEAILQALAKAGATVVGTATGEKGVESISNGLAALSAKGAGRVLDVRDASGCAAFVDRVQEEFGSFDKYIWGFVDGKPVINQVGSLSEIQATSPISDAMSKDLRKRGFGFVGSTICYAFMQAVGMVNDHEVRCFRYLELGG